MGKVVLSILEQIDRLSEKDRRALELRLSERGELEWRREVAKARVIARRRGIDQAAIDRAIHQRRYGT